MSEPTNLCYSTPPGRNDSKQIVALVICWSIVAIPAAWGIAQTVRKSVPLFTAPAASTAPRVR